MKIPVVVQHRHVHLSQMDRHSLFGDQVFHAQRELGHKGQFVSDTFVKVVGPNGIFENVRVLGPERDQTQIELSASDAFALGLQAPTRVSGDLARAGTCGLKGPNGEVKASYSTIIPARHFHCSPSVAHQLGVSHLDIISAKTTVSDELIEHIVVRVHPTYSLEFHLTKDEAAELWLHSGDFVKLV